MTAIRIRNPSGEMVAGVELDDTKRIGARLLLPTGSYEAVLFADGDDEPCVIPFKIEGDGGQHQIGPIGGGVDTLNVADIAVRYGGRGW